MFSAEHGAIALYDRPALHLLRTTCAESRGYTCGVCGPSFWSCVFSRRSCVFAPSPHENDPCMCVPAIYVRQRGRIGESVLYCFGFHCLSRVMRWIPYLHHASSAPRARPARGNRHRQTQKCSEVTVLPQTRKTEKQWAHPSKSQPPMFFFHTIHALLGAGGRDAGKQSFVRRSS